jgi:hypothetical protein
VTQTHATSQQPDHPRRLRAQFKGWRVEEKPRRSGEPAKYSLSKPLADEIIGPFTLDIVMDAVDHASRYRVYVIPTHQRLRKTFGLSKLQDAKSYVRSQFKEQLTDWEVIEK